MLMRRVKLLLLKLIITAVFFLLMFTLVFGVYRVEDSHMVPSINSGDILIYYRPARQYNHGDVIMVSLDGRIKPLRIAAAKGDTVDIEEGNLMINGYSQQEPKVIGRTEKKDNLKVSYPEKIENNCYFLLGDNRKAAEDSRDFGPVSKKQIRGRVITVISRGAFKKEKEVTGENRKESREGNKNIGCCYRYGSSDLLYCNNHIWNIHHMG